MADPVGSFSGLASGIQWRDMVDQIMQLEESRRLSPVQTQLSGLESRQKAWSTYSGLVTRLNQSALKLRDGAAGRQGSAWAGPAVGSCGDRRRAARAAARRSSGARIRAAFGGRTRETPGSVARRARIFAEDPPGVRHADPRPARLLPALGLRHRPEEGGPHS